MIEILPNWHPVFVHFTVALFVVATGAFVLSVFAGHYTMRYQARVVGRWNLWLGVAFTLFTVVAGIIAFNTVEHDTPSHLVMKDHRLVALITAGVFLLLAVWSLVCLKTDREEGKGFVMGMVAGTVLVMLTAWFGGELVYRHGLGVMSLPDQGQHDHGAGGDHSHGDSLDGEGHHNSVDEGHGHDEKPDSDSHVHKDGKAHQH